MNKYKLLVQEVHIQPYVVEAESEEKAKEIILDALGEGEFEEGELEYSCTFEPEEWSIEKL